MELGDYLVCLPDTDVVMAMKCPTCGGTLNSSAQTLGCAQDGKNREADEELHLSTTAALTSFNSDGWTITWSVVNAFPHVVGAVSLHVPKRYQYDSQTSAVSTSKEVVLMVGEYELKGFVLTERILDAVNFVSTLEQR